MLIVERVVAVVVVGRLRRHNSSEGNERRIIFESRAAPRSRFASTRRSRAALARGARGARCHDGINIHDDDKLSRSRAGRNYVDAADARLHSDTAPTTRKRTPTSLQRLP